MPLPNKASLKKSKRQKSKRQISTSRPSPPSFFSPLQADFPGSAARGPPSPEGSSPGAAAASLEPREAHSWRLRSQIHGAQFTGKCPDWVASRFEGTPLFSWFRGKPKEKTTHFGGSGKESQTPKCSDGRGKQVIAIVMTQKQGPVHLTSRCRRNCQLHLVNPVLPALPSNAKTTSTRKRFSLHTVWQNSPN